MVKDEDHAVDLVKYRIEIGQPTAVVNRTHGHVQAVDGQQDGCWHFGAQNTKARERVRIGHGCGKFVIDSQSICAVNGVHTPV